MSLKHEALAFAVRVVSEKTSLLPKPDGLTLLIDTFINGESYDHRLARNLEAELDKAAAKVKNFRNRNYTKITTAK